MNRYVLTDKLWKIIQSESYKAHIICPKCGLKANLSNHTINEAGEVNPSLVCPNDNCDFHEWVILENWNKERGEL
jgi:hypothetical protein